MCPYTYIPRKKDRRRTQPGLLSRNRRQTWHPELPWSISPSHFSGRCLKIPCEYGAGLETSAIFATCHIINYARCRVRYRSPGLLVLPQKKAFVRLQETHFRPRTCLLNTRWLVVLLFNFLNPSNTQKRAKKIAEFKQRIQHDIEERRAKEVERLAAQHKKCLDERTARRSNILRFWGRAQVSYRWLAGHRIIAKSRNRA